jgi:hypothetical protein
MAWKRMKRYVTVAGIFGESNSTNPKRAYAVKIAEWGSRSLSNTGILNVFLGREISTRKPLPNQFTKGNQFFREFAPAGISIAVIPNTSKSLSLLVK